MRKLLLAFALAFVPALALAQNECTNNPPLIAISVNNARDANGVLHQNVCWNPVTGAISIPSLAANALTTPASIVQSGLIAQYQFNQGSGTVLTDTSGNGNDGTLCAGGAAPTWIAGSTGGLAFVGSSNQCVTLPAALNSARTVILYLGYQPTLNAPTQPFPEPMTGNGGVLAGSVGFELQQHCFASTGGVTCSSDGGNYAWERAGVAGYATRSRLGFTGNGTVTWTLGSAGDAPATLDHIYINGYESNGYVGGNQGATAGTMTSGTYQFGGANASFGNVFYTGNIFFALLYNRPLTAGEVNQDTIALNNIMTVRGLSNPTLDTANQVNSAVCDGDSITYGLGITQQNVWCGGLNTGTNPNMTLNGNGSWLITDSGTSGAFITRQGTNIATLNNDAPYASDIFLQPTVGNAAAIIWAGTNDLFAGVTVSQVYNALAQYCKGRRIARSKCFVATMISRTTQDANKNALNALLRTGWSDFADGLIDVAADPSLGADGANASATYFQVDHIHPTDFAGLNNIAPVMDRAINRVFGNDSWTAATTYTTSAPAATATTAGSCGAAPVPNTCTLTFAANPFPAGSTIVCTGITPAAYNTPAGTTYNVRTSTATQITFLNSSTPGVITVQGTCSTSLQKDVDTFTILGGSAVSPSFTLESCIGYTGQNIALKNQNTTSSWVLTPFQASETIDGAATLTMPAATSGNFPVVILQSTLVSASAAGCVWKRMQ